MIAKLTVTTECGGKCMTCPNWKTERQYMSYENFVEIWDKIIGEERIHKVVINNVGDIYYHPECVRMLKYINRNKRKNLYIAMVTNAAKMDFVPLIDELAISFNGGNKESYERVTGLDFEYITRNIKRHYREIKNNVKLSEIDILIFEENKESESGIKELWDDFPGRVRVSYKYDNQQEKDLTLKEWKSNKQIFCNYLDILNIDWNGNIVMCAHDWERKNIWGNMITDNFDDLIRNPARIKKIKEQGKGEYTGICEKCNYNIEMKEGMIRYEN